MTAQILLDTHILLRWLVEPRKLSGEQIRVLRQAIRRHLPLAVSAITLLELAQLSVSRPRASRAAEAAFRELENPVFEVLPLTIEIAREVPSLTNLLRDPADCVIAATARVHGLRLVTSDQRILEANVVSTIV